VKGPVANRGKEESVKDAVTTATAELVRHRRARDPIGLAVERALRAGADPAALGAAYESLLDGSAPASELELKPARGQSRKERGAYYTPSWLVDLVLDSTLTPLIGGAGEQAILRMRLLDPACGAGAFLVAAGQRLAARLSQLRGGSVAAVKRSRRDVVRCLYGMDNDPVAVELCRAAIMQSLGADPGRRVVLGDGLLDEPPGGCGFDAVVGNPPYLNRLERLTEVDRATALRFKDRFGQAARAYTDIAALFLLRAAQVTRRGGRVGLVLPQSVLGSRDSAGVRRAVSASGTLTDLWLADEHVFDASVFVCVPTIAIGETSGTLIARTIGKARRKVASVALDSDSWAAIAAVDVPNPSLHSKGTVQDLAEVTADFRDEYYGLRGRVIEDAPRQPVHRFPRLISTGLVDIASCHWGKRPCRFAGKAWESPRVNVDALEPSMRAWASRRLRPKVLLATQTRVLEAAVDERGEWLPVTPLISIVPRPPDVWKLGAALCSPVLTAIAAKLTAGTGLSRGAIKLSANQARSLPMPAESLAGAASHFRTASRATGEAARENSILKSGIAACEAYGIRGRAAADLVEWWRERMRA
jgi:hypothetical protein